MTTDTQQNTAETSDFAPRVAELIGKMTVPEKVSQLVHEAKAVERLGIPAYNWWSEALHGVGRAGKATIFPQAIGMAATFDPDLVEKVADAVSSEARAKHHAAAARDDRRSYFGLTFWSPNVNIFRDPRWGRGQETWGEDPVLTGAMGAAFVRGLQGKDSKYMKVAACAKHYAVHSGPEAERHSFNAVVNLKDLYETYLPAFKSCVDAGVETVMGAYNRTNDEACVASTLLLEKILRGQWGFKGHVVSDCWAINNLHNHHKITKNVVESAALALKRGCDLNCGGCYNNLGQALQEGMITEADLDRALTRLFTTRFKLGMFDNPADVPYSRIGMDVVRCRKHIALAREAAGKSIVLLKNKPGILPFGANVRKILVTGPNAGNIDVLLGNYFGSAGRMVTVAEGLIERAPEGVIVDYRTGCQLNQGNVNPVEWVMGDAKSADAIVAVMGITNAFEGEEGEAFLSADTGDRHDIGLPRPQVEFVKRLAEQGKPVVLVVAGGSPVDFSELHDVVDAILFMWYPGEQGGAAVADVLFGDVNPSGRLPLTFPKSLAQLPPFEDYSMQGRTYRYMSQTPMYPFGFGLSYTRFEYGDLKLSKSRIKAGQGITAEVTVKNAGDRDGDEVVQLYITDEQATLPVPIWALKAFKRITLKAGQSKTMKFKITPRMLEMIDMEGQGVIEPGSFTVTIGGSCPSARSEDLGAARPVLARFDVAGGPRLA